MSQNTRISARVENFRPLAVTGLFAVLMRGGLAACDQRAAGTSYPNASTEASRMEKDAKAIAQSAAVATPDPSVPPASQVFAQPTQSTADSRPSTPPPGGQTMSNVQKSDQMPLPTQANGHSTPKK